MNPKFAAALATIAFLLALTGCSTYQPPGARADLQAFAPPELQKAFAAVPSNPFPAAVALVRVQAPAYTNYQVHRHGGAMGSGRYSVILSRELGEDTLLDRVADLPDLAGIVALNRLLLPSRLEDDRPIRTAAARLNAGLVLVYTFDTTFIDEQRAKPLSVITLGLSPTRRIMAVTTASALLMDTRTGYIYAAFETTERLSTASTSWGSADTADRNRLETERRAFEKLVAEFRTSWPTLVQRARSAAAAPADRGPVPKSSFSFGAFSCV